jgi:hypothetical protein
MAKRLSRLESISRRFWFEHESGRRLYPYRSTERNSGRWAFRVGPPGTGANKTINQTLLDDEDDVFRHVFGKGWSVRLCDKDGKYDGFYNKDGYSIRRTSESAGRGGPSVADYSRILQALKPSEKSRAFLQAHYYALGRKSSMDVLAHAVGYDSYEPANLHYGRMAHAVADALPMPPNDIPGGGYDSWMQALAWANGERDAQGHFVWTLRPEVATALERLGWVVAEAEDSPNPDADGSVPEIGTECQTLVAARRGQGMFRSRVLQYWGGRCAVTGCAIAPVLLASHIKRWADSTDAERVDGFNGLLLTPNLDRLFDRHLISFDDDGVMLISPSLLSRERRALGIEAPLRIERLHARHLRYLKAHRRSFIANGPSPCITESNPQ